MVCMDLCLCLIVQYILIIFKYRASEASEEKICSAIQIARFCVNVLSASLFLIAKDTIIMFCHQNDVHPQKRVSL